MALISSIANGSIKASEGSLDSTASDIKSKVTQMRDIFRVLDTKLTSEVIPNYKGFASDELATKYEMLKTKFEPFCQCVDQFAEVLVQSKAELSTTESVIAKSAEGLTDVNIG